MNNKYYKNLIFELSHPGRIGYSLPNNNYGKEYALNLPQELLRQSETCLPEADELTVVRHYTNMSNNNFGVDTGFYPLGSCTMKYNPKINEEISNLSGFNIHPLAPDYMAQGSLYIYSLTAAMLSEVCGMSQFTLNPYAGAHGELTGLMVIRAYHEQRGDLARRKILVPDSAHGTNPASAAVCGLEVVQVKSLPDGTVDVDDLRTKLSAEVAGMMMTNPNTLGIFEYQIPEIARLVHECGGLMYYDGANLNAILGVCRPGDMGFDVMHVNLHKTFSTPHGGGGPGSGPIGVRSGLEHLLPCPTVEHNEDDYFHQGYNENNLGAVTPYYGNFAIIIRACCYLLSLGKEHIADTAKLAVLNANYIKEQLKAYFKLPLEGLCKHEFVFDGLRDEFGGDHHDANHVTTLDVAKRLLDYGFHAPTIYFPLLFHEALMIEPTETESKETLDDFIDVMKKIAIEARDNRETVKNAPLTTPVRRLDDVKAVKSAQFTYRLLQKEA